MIANLKISKISPIFKKIGLFFFYYGKIVIGGNMKTKFFVSGSSGINYIKHKSDIDAINSYIMFNEQEEYQDYTEMNSKEFYIRLTNDLTARPKIIAPSFDEVNTIISDVFNNDYTNIIFIINDFDVDLINMITRYKDLHKDQEIDLIITKLYSYPLAYASIEAEKIYNKEFDIEHVFSYIKKLEADFKMYIFIPEQEILQGVYTIDYDLDIINQKFGNLYDGNKDGVIHLKKYRNNRPFEYMIQAFIKETENLDIVPFILYTNEYSRYLDVLNKKIKNAINKKVENYYLTPKYGSIYGPTALVLGFIIK